MTRRILDAAVMSYISLFESLTGAKVKDCISDGELTIIVERGNMGLAIGRNGSNLKRAESALKKKINLIEFSEDVVQFTRNVIYPIRMVEIEKQDRLINIKGRDKKTKGLLIGRDRANLKRTLSIIRRFFDVEDIRIL